MLKAINTKILLAILAVLAAIAGAVAYQRHEAEVAAAAAQRAAAILQQQQRNAEEQKSATKLLGNRWKRTANSIIPPLPMKAKPGSRIFLNPF